jgi:O-antigen ligase
VQTVRSIQLWLTIAALTLAPLFFGSVDQLWVATWTAVLSIATLCGTAGPMDTRQARIVSAFLLLSCAYATVAIVQILPHLIDPLNDPIWQQANDLLGLDLLPRISSRAEIPLVAVGHFLLFVISFLSGFFVGTSGNGYVLVRLARYSILLYALYGLVSRIFTPNLLLWLPKPAYHNYLTATFVNHNTAATFLGAGVILWFCTAVSSLQSFGPLSIRVLLLIRSSEDVALKLALRAAGALVCFFALLLTGSRGGLICSALGMLVAVGLMVAGRARPNFWLVVASGTAALVVTAVVLSWLGRIGSQGVVDSARWSVYELCIEAIGQRPLLGAGAGTFADLFPSLRPDNFTTWGVWDYAHSTILEIAVEMGIPVAASIVIGAIASLFILARTAIKAKDRARRSLSAIAGIAVLTYLHAMIDFSLQIPGYFIVFGILLGCGLGYAPIGPPTLDRKARAAVTGYRSATRTL